MSNIDAVNALITAINFDRFDEIEARHQPDVLFTSFRGPTLRDAVSVGDWHRTFLRDYADCNYADLEYIEEGDTICLRATIEAKGYDWRAFEQRVVEVFRMEDGGVAERRMYAMLRDIELDKPATTAMNAAKEFRGGNTGETRKVVEALFAALEAGDTETARSLYDLKAVLIDGVYGISGPGADSIRALASAIPRPAFGKERVTHLFAGQHDAVAEIGVDPSRPRLAQWFRLVEGKIMVVEGYWMLREIGVNPFENLAHDRHMRRVIQPI